MTEERQTDATAGTDGTTGDAVVASGGQTVEEVETFWRNRQSGQDRAHNAETAELRRQIAAAQAPAAPVGESPEQTKIRELEQERDAAIAQARATALQSQYPEIGRVLGDAITALPPEKAAALEAMVAGGERPAPRIDPNAAARGNGSIQSPDAKPMNEKTKDELLADLQRVAPLYQEAAKEGLL